MEDKDDDDGCEDISTHDSASVSKGNEPEIEDTGKRN